VELLKNGENGPPRVQIGPWRPLGWSLCWQIKKSLVGEGLESNCRRADNLESLDPPWSGKDRTVAGEIGTG